MRRSKSSKSNHVRLGSVLAPVVGSTTDVDTVNMACELVNDANGIVHIIYVIEVPREHPVDTEQYESTARGEEILHEMEAVAELSKCTAEAELLQARKAGLAIVHEAVDKQVDAIVLGTKYKHSYGVFTRGETIPYVLKHAPCQVIIMRLGTNGREQ